jgi:hypothetical protein
MMQCLPVQRGEQRAWVEEAETLRLPLGAAEEMLANGEPPVGPICTRIAMTRLARELGREYRLRYGVRLTVDAAGIEAMQYHLLSRFAESRLDGASTPTMEVEIVRHGALFGEILARRLDAEWMALGDGGPTDWALRVPPGARVWPVWRVRNFLRRPWDGRGALIGAYDQLRAGAAHACEP